ncbi:MAG TPA: S41 family peptidase [Candidatus Bipolaricaulota bacterium]|nr:S41 family peptidase [Candidatus Bipolaricaulota bacterium]
MPTYQTKPNKTFFRTSIIVVLMIAVGLAGFFIGQASKQSVSAVSGAILTQQQLPDEFNMSLMREVWKVLQQNFVNQSEIDNEKVFYSVLEGMVAGLNDPYTVFLTPDETEEFNEDIDGKFQGIGAEIAVKDSQLTIVAPIASSPAERAGLKAGDKIIAVDGKETAAMTLSEAVRNIRGEKGTVVKLLISRNDVASDVEVTRDIIYIQSVKTEIKDGNIGYIDITGFNTDTNSLFKDAVDEMLDKKVNGLVLNLRNNPGGLLDSAIFVASAWIENGQTVVSEQFGDGQKMEYASKGQPAFVQMPTVVLINEGSASGSEIVAGALKDYGLATLVGKKTFGKGSVQNLHSLSDGSSVKVTIAKWLTPSGASINEEGIEPDQEVEITDEDFVQEKDPQLERALEILKSK